MSQSPTSSHSRKLHYLTPQCRQNINYRVSSAPCARAIIDNRWRVAHLAARRLCSPWSVWYSETRPERVSRLLIQSLRDSTTSPKPCLTVWMPDFKGPARSSAAGRADPLTPLCVVQLGKGMLNSFETRIPCFTPRGSTGARSLLE